jgi:hypothetical protein
MLVLDLWIKAGTPVLSALDGSVHSCNFNAGFGDYGPTIVYDTRLKIKRFIHYMGIYL